MSKKIKKPLEEATELGALKLKKQMQNQQQDTTQTSSTSFSRPRENKSFMQDIKGFRIDFCHSMSGWQSEVVQRLLQGRDVYVTTYPASGKTMPVVCYWGEKILGLNPRLHSGADPKSFFQLMDIVSTILANPEKLEKLIYFCPVRALVTDISREFRERLAEIIKQAIELALKYTQYQPSQNVLMAAADLNIGLNSREIGNIINQLNSINRDIEYLSNREDSRRNRDVQNYISQLHKQRDNIIKSMQEKLGKELHSKLYNLVSTRSHVHKDGNPATALVTIAVIGSAETVFRQLGQNIGNVGLAVFDEAHLLQKLDEDDSLYDRVKNMYVALKNLRSYNKKCRVVFMSGTVHPEAADDLIKYVEKCFDRKFSKIFSEQAKNKAHIDVIANDNISNESWQVKLLSNPDSSNNLLIIFSQNRILNLVRKAIKRSGQQPLSSINRGDYSKKRSGYTSYAGILKPEDQNNQSQISADEIEKEMIKIPGAEEIYEPLQRQAISSGFGFIMRPDAREGVDDNNLKNYLKDQEIVAELFKKGKIHTLISTHAVGIGVNIYVKNLYIPSVESPGQGGRLEKMGTAASSQLYNRVGRAAFPIGSVITTSEYVDDVISALSAGQDQFERGINVDVGWLDCKVWIFMTLLTNAIKAYQHPISKNQKSSSKDHYPVSRGPNSVSRR